MRFAALLFVASVLVSTECVAADTHDEAQAVAKADATNPVHREWYLREMRPAFRPFFEPVVGWCVERAKPEDLGQVGLVFTVTPSGGVKRVFWKRPNGLTACLEQRLRGATFPKAPKEEFFFGLEFQL